jgi:hypothetical protein
MDMQSAYKQRYITDSVDQLHKGNVKHQYNRIDHQPLGHFCCVGVVDPQMEGIFVWILIA